MDAKYKNSIISNIALVIISVILALLLFKSCEKQKEMASAYNILDSELKITRIKNDKEIAEREVLMVSYNSLNDIIIRQNNELAELKGKVSEKTESAIIHKIHTRDTVYIPVTINGDTCDTQLSGTYDDEWANMNVYADKDTIIVDYAIRNEFIHKSEWKRKNIFSRPVLIGSVTNENPHSYTNNYLYYQKKSPNQTTGKLAAFLIGIGAGIILSK